MNTEQRIAALEDAYWRFQGAINAMELVALTGVLNFAKTQPNPFQWIQDYVEAARVTTKTLIPDADSPGDGNKLLKETKASMEAFLEQVVLHAGQLRNG